MGHRRFRLSMLAKLLGDQCDSSEPMSEPVTLPFLHEADAVYDTRRFRMGKWTEAWIRSETDARIAVLEQSIKTKTLTPRDPMSMIGVLLVLQNKCRRTYSMYSDQEKTFTNTMNASHPTKSLTKSEKDEFKKLVALKEEEAQLENACVLALNKLQHLERINFRNKCNVPIFKTHKKSVNPSVRSTHRPRQM